MNWQDYIERDPEVMLGKPVFKGTRLTVEFVLERLGQARFDAKNCWKATSGCCLNTSAPHRLTPPPCCGMTNWCIKHEVAGRCPHQPRDGRLGASGIEEDEGRIPCRLSHGRAVRFGNAAARPSISMAGRTRHCFGEAVAHYRSPIPAGSESGTFPAALDSERMAVPAAESALESTRADSPMAATTG